MTYVTCLFTQVTQVFSTAGKRLIKAFFTFRSCFILTVYGNWAFVEPKIWNTVVNT